MLKRDFFRLVGAVFVSQMSVGFHAQCAAILMSEPTRHRRDVHASLDAARSEQMPQVMVGDAFHPGQLRGAVYGFLALENAHNA